MPNNALRLLIAYPFCWLLLVLMMVLVIDCYSLLMMSTIHCWPLLISVMTLIIRRYSVFGVDTIRLHSVFVVPRLWRCSMPSFIPTLPLRFHSVLHRPRYIHCYIRLLFHSVMLFITSIVDCCSIPVMHSWSPCFVVVYSVVDVDLHSIVDGVDLLFGRVRFGRYIRYSMLMIRWVLFVVVPIRWFGDIRSRFFIVVILFPVIPFHSIRWHSILLLIVQAVDGDLLLLFPSDCCCWLRYSVVDEQQRCSCPNCPAFHFDVVHHFLRRCGVLSRHCYSLFPCSIFIVFSVRWWYIRYHSSHLLLLSRLHCCWSVWWHWFGDGIPSFGVDLHSFLLCFVFPLYLFPIHDPFYGDDSFRWRWWWWFDVVFIYCSVRPTLMHLICCWYVVIYIRWRWHLFCSVIPFRFVDFTMLLLAIRCSFNLGVIPLLIPSDNYVCMLILCWLVNDSSNSLMVSIRWFDSTVVFRSISCDWLSPGAWLIRAVVIYRRLMVTWPLMVVLMIRWVGGDDGRLFPAGDGIRLRRYKWRFILNDIWMTRWISFFGWWWTVGGGAWVYRRCGGLLSLSSCRHAGERTPVIVLLVSIDGWTLFGLKPVVGVVVRYRDVFWRWAERRMVLDLWTIACTYITHAAACCSGGVTTAMFCPGGGVTLVSLFDGPAHCTRQYNSFPFICSVKNLWFSISSTSARVPSMV